VTWKDGEGCWLDRSPTHLLHRVAQCADGIFDELVVVGALTPRQLAVLLTVSADEGLSQTGLAEQTGMGRSTVADVVGRLKRKGLLERRRTKRYTRAYAVTLTDEGRRVLQTVRPLANKVDDLILASLPGKQGENFLSRLRSIIATLQRAT
jgi:DNA-binding MarR family transcriptional regulator